MREELDKQLCEKYPLIFAQRNGAVHETCMCWGFCCGDGWYNIVDRLCAVIQNHIDWSYKHIESNKKFNEELAEAERNNFEDWPSWKSRDYRTIGEPVDQVVAIQVKEKFGGLRFYYSGGDEFVRAAVTMAEEMSYVTCEECGAPGTTDGKGWISTRCEEHRR